MIDKWNSDKSDDNLALQLEKITGEPAEEFTVDNFNNKIGDLIKLMEENGWRLVGEDRLQLPKESPFPLEWTWSVTWINDEQKTTHAFTAVNPPIDELATVFYASVANSFWLAEDRKWQ